MALQTVSFHIDTTGGRKEEEEREGTTRHVTSLAPSRASLSSTNKSDAHHRGGALTWKHDLLYAASPLQPPLTPCANGNDKNARGEPLTHTLTARRTANPVALNLFSTAISSTVSLRMSLSGSTVITKLALSSAL